MNYFQLKGLALILVMCLWLWRTAPWQSFGGFHWLFFCCCHAV